MDLNDTRSQRAEQIIADLALLEDPRCASCGGGLCRHQAVISMSMGFLGALACTRCLAAGMQQDPAAFRDSALAFIEGLDCWRAGWLWASDQEGFGACELHPPCLWGTQEGSARSGATPRATTDSAAIPHAAISWDAGDLACGELLLQLRTRLKDMTPGTVLELSSRDPASPEDLPAWCELTGHTLVASEHPRYWIRRRNA